jgi:hypothetical protein
MGNEPENLELVKGSLDVFILKTLNLGPAHGYAISRLGIVIEAVTEMDSRSSSRAKPRGRALLDAQGVFRDLADPIHRDRRRGRRECPARARLR